MQKGPKDGASPGSISRFPVPVVGEALQLPHGRACVQDPVHPKHVELAVRRFAMLALDPGSTWLLLRLGFNSTLCPLFWCSILCVASTETFVPRSQQCHSVPFCSPPTFRGMLINLGAYWRNLLGNLGGCRGRSTSVRARAGLCSVKRLWLVLVFFFGGLYRALAWGNFFWEFGMLRHHECERPRTPNHPRSPGTVGLPPQSAGRAQSWCREPLAAESVAPSACRRAGRLRSLAGRWFQGGGPLGTGTGFGRKKSCICDVMCGVAGKCAGY